MKHFTSGAQLCDYYTCEIYPTNRARFADVISRKVDYPAEFWLWFGYEQVVIRNILR